MVGRGNCGRVVYWGSGYDTRERKLPYDGNNNKFHAFSLNGR